MDITLDSSGNDSLLSDPSAATAYFTISEALTNIVKHAGTSEAMIELRFDDACVRLRVADAGAGGANTSAGTGLAGLMERVRSVGGQIEITSAPGEGTVVAATVPLESAW